MVDSGETGFDNGEEPIPQSLQPPLGRGRSNDGLNGSSAGHLFSTLERQRCAMVSVTDPRARLEAARVDISRMAAAEVDLDKRGQLSRLAEEIAHVASAVPPPGRHVSQFLPPTSPPAPASVRRGELPDDGGPAAITPPWNLDDVSDLPEDLVEQLGLRKTDFLARWIRELLAEAGAPLGTKAIAVACYRRYGERIDPEKLARKLYRMTQPKGHAVLTVPPGLKGQYGLATWGEAGRRNSGPRSTAPRASVDSSCRLVTPGPAA